MGHQTTIYGYIGGLQWRQEDYRKYQIRNIEIVSALPEEDIDPYFVRGIFSSEVPDDSYRKGIFITQILHFGSTIKTRGIDQRDNWILKFEELLKKLYWSTAIVHIDTDVFGKYTYDWHTKMDFVVFSEVEELMPTTRWKRCIYFNGEILESVEV